MKKILINAYACSPEMGSEPGMAWNWCMHMARHFELFIITEGEFRDNIEKTLPKMEYGSNMHFFYLPIGGDDAERSAKIRRMCWNQGDWRFYKYYRDWQLRVEALASEICQKEQIDVLHQLNMIGFREPGYLWRLSKQTGIPFVWGPIGGLKQFPVEYLKGAGLKMNFFMRMKNVINRWQLKHDKRVRAALGQAKLLFSSIPDSERALRECHGLESVIIPETGCFLAEKDEDVRDYGAEVLRVMWVGKFDFRKRLDIALKAVATATTNICLEVYGSGNEQQVREANAMSEALGLGNRVKWMGNCPNEVIHEAMRRSHLFLFTSVSEDTSTVVMEALSNKLPVLCFDACGMGYVINESVGVRVRLTCPEQSEKNFARHLDDLNNNREKLKCMAEAVVVRRVELSWERKAEKVAGLLSEIISSI